MRAETYVVTALLTKWAYMNGRIKHHRKKMARLAGDFTYVVATHKLFSRKIDLQTRLANEHRTRSSLRQPQEHRQPTHGVGQRS